MSIANPQKVCYVHILAKKGKLPSDQIITHAYACNGYDKSLQSSSRTGSPCLDFVSVYDVVMGLCAYEHRARNGFGESLVRTMGHNCNACNSNHESGRDTEKHSACTSYTPVLQVILGLCAWNLRSQRLLDLYNGDRTKLKSEERFCLGECDASRDSPCPGYIDIKHVVEQTCLHRTNLDTKLRKGGSVQGLEEICAGCRGQCETRKCESSFISVTEKHHF